MWMLGQDVTQGALAQRGFRKQPHPQGLGSSIWSQGTLHMHSQALWIERVDHLLVYHRSRGQFFRLPLGSVPPSLDDSQRVPFKEGWREFWPWLQRYEQAVKPGYRERLLRITPPGLRRHRRAWREAFRADEAPGSR